MCARPAQPPPRPSRTRTRTAGAPPRRLVQLGPAPAQAAATRRPERPPRRRGRQVSGAASPGTAPGVRAGADAGLPPRAAPSLHVFRRARPRSRPSPARALPVQAPRAPTACLLGACSAPLGRARPRLRPRTRVPGPLPKHPPATVLRVPGTPQRPPVRPLPSCPSPSGQVTSPQPEDCDFLQQPARISRLLSAAAPEKDPRPPAGAGLARRPVRSPLLQKRPVPRPAARPQPSPPGPVPPPEAGCPGAVRPHAARAAAAVAPAPPPVCCARAILVMAESLPAVLLIPVSASQVPSPGPSDTLAGAAPDAASEVGPPPQKADR